MDAKTPSWLRILEVLGIVSAIIYAFITAFMWRDSHKNFIVDEQAVVYAESAFPQTVNEQTRFIANVKIGNAGKTFAKQIVSQYVLLILRNTESASFDYSHPDTNEIMGMMAPNNSSLSIFQVTTLADQPIGRFLKKEEVDDLLAGRRYLLMYGQGSYWDVFGKQHWFHHCNWKSYFQSSTYAAANCTLYNNIGDGPPPKD